MTLKHEALIREALDGKPIEFRTCTEPNSTKGKWVVFENQRLAVAHMAAEYVSYEYRRQPNPDIVQYRAIPYFHKARECSIWPAPHQCLSDRAALEKITYDGETGQVKSIELVKE